METDSSVEDTLEANTPSSTDQSLLDQKVRSCVIVLFYCPYLKVLQFYKNVYKMCLKTLSIHTSNDFFEHNNALSRSL